MKNLQIPEGIECEEVFEVKSEHAAKHVGSGDVEVLSTPSMILFMEAASLRCVQKYLPEDLTTVGTRVCVDHKHPAPIGDKIVVKTKLVKVEGRKLVFEVKAIWRDIVVGEGIHERFIVDRQKFSEKLREKLKK